MVWGQPLRSCSRSIHSALSLWLSVTLGLLARFFWSSWSWGMEDRRRRGSRGWAPSQKRMKVELDLDLKVNRSHLWSKLAKLALKISSSFHLSVWIRHFGFQSDHHLPPAKTGWKRSDDTTISFKFKYREEDVWDHLIWGIKTLLFQHFGSVGPVVLFHAVYRDCAATLFGAKIPLAWQEVMKAAFCQGSKNTTALTNFSSDFHSLESHCCRHFSLFNPVLRHKCRASPEREDVLSGHWCHLLRLKEIKDL